VNNSFEELEVLVDKFDFDFSGPMMDLYSEVRKSKKLIKKFVEIDFVLNVSLDELGKVPYKPLVNIYPFTEKGNMFAIYFRYKLENGVLWRT
jgi:hypothetical protein